MKSPPAFAIVLLSSVRLFANDVQPSTPAVPIGVNIWSIHAVPQGVPAWERQIEQIHAMGFAAVTILPQFFVDLKTGAVTANDPTPNARFGGMTDAELSAAIRKAKSLGMIATVSPTLEAADRAVFRGHIAFNDPLPGQPAAAAKPENGADSAENENRFWSGYQARATHIAGIAQSAGADRLNIGAELSALDADPRNAAHWAELIEAVDAVFHGRIGYTTVHWTFDSGPTREMIYANPKIDYISLSAYFDLATPEQAMHSGAAGNERFIEIVRKNFAAALDDRVLPAARELKKPVILNEFGVPPYDGASVHPWDWTIGDRAAYDPAESRNATEGIFRSLALRGDEIECANVWVWDWPGGFPGERFGISNDPADRPETTFDESQMSMTVEFLKEFLKR